MADGKIIGYKRVFGFVMPDWVDEQTIKMAATALLSVAAMLIVLIFFIWPNFDVIKVKQNELAGNKNDLEVLKNSKAGLDNVNTQLSQTEQDIILNAIPQEYSPEGAVYMLRRISSDTGVTITSYSLPSGTLLDTSEVAGGVGSANGEMVEFATYPIKITVTSSVEALLDFIAKVESSLPLGVVSDLNLQEVTKLSSSINGKTVQLALEIMFFQSKLRGVNLSKVEAFTTQDIALAKSLAAYNLLLVPQEQTGSAPVATGSGSIFGF
jgi:Tfp pilus assembly protein PilO